MTTQPHRCIVFRVDASIQIGTGHVMRCLTLADALSENGADCKFISREHSGNLTSYIQNRGYKVIGLPSIDIFRSYDEKKQNQHPRHANWLGVDWLHDAKETLAILKDITVGWLIIDHYGIDTRWETLLRPACDNIMVIDDLADRDHNCDLLLDQNLGRSANDYLDIIPKYCKTLLGPKFALLRPEFAALRDYSLKRRANPEVKRIIISMGGIDKDNVTSTLLGALNACNLGANSHIDIVMGQQAPWIDQVKKQCSLIAIETNVLVDTTNMAQLMAESDLAIGAAGMTTWERCTLGLPSFIIVLADNQINSALELQKKGAAKLISHATELIDVYPINTKKDQLEKMSELAAAVTDGCGTIRVRNQLEN